MSGVPLLADVTGRRVVMVGGGTVAAAKLDSFLEAQARLIVIAPDAVDLVRDAGARERLLWHDRPYRQGDLRGAHLAVAATSDPEVNGAVSQEAERERIFCVRVDGGGSAALMAVLRHGPFLLATSTGGRAPALARHVKHELAGRFGPEYGLLADLLGELRSDAQVQATLATLSAADRAAAWRSILETDILDLLRTGRLDTAREVASSCLSSFSA